MSILRQDPTTREWVIIAPERGRRPHDLPGTSTSRARPPRDPSCPFCPGNEAQTPRELLRLENPEEGGWSVRVIANKFAALGDGEDLGRREAGPLFREMNGVGRHEVIVETPMHDRALVDRAEDEIERMLEAYQVRYLSARADPGVQYIIIFKNHGEHAGTSLAHPHSQLVATPIAPLRMRRQHEIAAAHYDDTGRCLYSDIVEAELRAKVRVVLKTEAFVVFHPFASRAPFETWIVPRRPQPSFGQISRADRHALGRVMRRTLGGLTRALDDPDFNYIVHSAPTADESKAYYLWHIQIIPRVATIAGFELGSGIYVTSTLPEDSAVVLRGLVQ